MVAISFPVPKPLVPVFIKDSEFLGQYVFDLEEKAGEYGWALQDFLY